MRGEEPWRRLMVTCWQCFKDLSVCLSMYLKSSQSCEDLFELCKWYDLMMWLWRIVHVIMFWNYAVLLLFALLYAALSYIFVCFVFIFWSCGTKWSWNQYCDVCLNKFTQNWILLNKTFHNVCAKKYIFFTCVCYTVVILSLYCCFGY